MANRLVRPRSARQLLPVLLVLALATSLPAAAQIPNGDFETGDLSGGWTVGGANRVEVLQGSDIVPAITAPGGNWFVMVGNGRGNIPGNQSGDFDENGITDYDHSTLSISFDTTGPETISFDWDFFTAEIGQPPAFDDFFIVSLDGLPVFGRSVHHPGGSSPYPDTAPYDGTRYRVNTTGALANNNFPSGRAGVESAEITIPAAGTHTLEFLVADQGDSRYDSGLLIDNLTQNPLADLWITKDDGVSMVLPGNPTTYYITVGNDGPNDAAGALVTDIFPAELLNVSWTCAATGGASCPGSGTGPLNELVDLPVGSTVTFTVSATVDPGASGALSNTAEVDAPPDLFDSDESNNSATDIDALEPAVLPIQITDSSGANLLLKDGGFLWIPIASQQTAMSGDGRVVAFSSSGDHTGGNTDLGNEIFVHTDSGGFEQITDVATPVAYDHADGPALSRSGRWLVFSSSADLTGGNPDWNPEIFRWDRTNQVMTQITFTTSGENRLPTVTNNGRRIAFRSTATDLIPGFNADGNQEVAVWNNGALIGYESTGCQNYTPRISQHNQGRYVALTSNGDLTGGNADGNPEVFQWDWSQGAAGMTQVTDSSGALGHLNDAVSSSSDGDLLAFLSTADYTGENADGSLEVFTWDRDSDSFTQVTVTSQLSLHTMVAINQSGDHMAIERFSLLANTFELHHVDLDSGVSTLVVSGNAYLPAVGLSGSTAILAFQSSEDYVGQNGDGNMEIWKALVE